MHVSQRDLTHLALLLIGFYLATGVLVVLWLNVEEDVAAVSQSRIREKLSEPWKRMIEQLPNAAGRAYESGREMAQPVKHKTAAELLGENVRIFCFILTCPNNTIKAMAVKETWLTRCNGYVFISTEDDPTLPSLSVDIEESWDNIWEKTKFGFWHAHNTSIDAYDWFMKADDDTYVILENLRFLLSNYSPDDPIYFGCNFKKHIPQGYMSGGAGYVLSRQAVRLFVEDGLNKNLCEPQEFLEEDMEAGRCLESLGVKAMDSRDERGLGRFFPFLPSAHMEIRRTPLTPNMTAWWWYADYLKYQENGVDCCSDRAISFHYATQYDMYALEYLIYHLKTGVANIVYSRE